MVPARLLRRFELFSGLTEEELAFLASLGREEVYEPGTVLFKEGDPAREFFLVLAGEVALEMGLQLWPGAPKRQVEVETVSGGGSFGWSALIPPHTRTLSARCRGEARLIALPGDELRRLLDSDPKIGHKVSEKLAELIASRLRDTRAKLTEFLRGEELASGFTPEEATLLQRVQYLIDFRWLAVLGVITVAIIARMALGIGFPLHIVLAIAAAIGLYNLGFLLYGKGALQVARAELIPRARRFILFQSGLDLLAFTAIFRFSGGIENPFVLYYIFHTIIAGVLLPYRSAYLITTLAALLISALAGLEYFGVIPHYHLEGFLPFELYRQGLVILGILSALITTLYVSTYIATSIAGELRKRQREVAKLKDRCFLDMKELEEVNKRLVELDRLRTHFLAIASHDLKAPLAAVQSYLGVLLGGFVGELTDRQREMLSRSSLRLKELLNLINDLLDATRIEAGQIVQEMEEIELQPVVESALENVRSQAGEKGLKLELEMALPEGLPRVKVRASARRLEQALTNLLNNAVKFTPQGGEVHLEVKDQGDHLQVTVRDTGVGIAPEELPRIFEEFYRGKGAEGKGAGLGLAIAKKIVEAHGGKIWAESPDPVTGRGSRFTFTIPKLKEDQQ
ncbi:MAG: ATP-binding protein [Candidatus Bipolaricaulia bacterium]